MAEQETNQATTSNEFWGILELMGHVRLAGKVSEQEIFGGKMGRIDIPKPDGGGFVTQFFGGSSVYRLTPCSEEVARSVAKRNQPQPVHAWELPRPALADVRQSVEDQSPGYDPGDEDHDPGDPEELDF